MTPQEQKTLLAAYRALYKAAKAVESALPWPSDYSDARSNEAKATQMLYDAIDLCEGRTRRKP
jgi:TorA maturation chaperone TorD